MEHGPYIAEKTQNAVYIVRCLWVEAEAKAFPRPRDMQFSHLIEGAGHLSAHKDVGAGGAAQAVLITVAVGLQQLDDVPLPGCLRCCCQLTEQYVHR
jgi:hypothetical protein